MSRVKMMKVKTNKSVSRRNRKLYDEDGAHKSIVRYCAPPFEKMKPMPDVPPLKREVIKKEKSSDAQKLNDVKFMTIDQVKEYPFHPKRK